MVHLQGKCNNHSNDESRLPADDARALRAAAEEVGRARAGRSVLTGARPLVESVFQEASREAAVLSARPLTDSSAGRL